MVLVLAVGTTIGLLVLLLLLATLLVATVYCLLLLFATLLVATVYCLLYVCEYGVLLLAIHIPDRLAAACYLLGAFLTTYKKNVSSNVTISPESRCNVCINREHVKFFLTKSRQNDVAIRHRETCFKKNVAQRQFIFKCCVR